MASFVDLALYRDEDSEEERMTKGILYALVNNAIPPEAAAHRFDSWVVSNATSRLLSVLARESPHRLTADEEEENIHIASFAPNPAGDVWLMIDEIGTAAMGVPPDHPGHDKLVEMLKVLQAMPSRTVPQCNSEDLTGRSTPHELWANMNEEFTVSQWLLELGQDVSRETSAIGKIGSDEQRKWHNYNAFLARLTRAGICDCSRFSVLEEILHELRPESDVGEGGRLAGNAVAAAQWIIYASNFIYASCRQLPASDSGRPPFWTAERWKLWKKQFKKIAEEERHDKISRSAAGEAVHRMFAEEQKHGPII